MLNYSLNCIDNCILLSVLLSLVTFLLNSIQIRLSQDLKFENDLSIHCIKLLQHNFIICHYYTACEGFVYKSSFCPKKKPSVPQFCYNDYRVILNNAMIHLLMNNYCQLAFEGHVGKCCN